MSKRDKPKANEDWPDGLDEHNQSPSNRWRHAAPLALLVLTLLVALPFVGLAGREETLATEVEEAAVAWHTPTRIRNGEFFEMRLTVDARQDIEELVVGVDAGLWEDFTINTFFPAPSEEASEEGELLFTFGPVEAGTTFLMKVDAQINPDMMWRNEGTVTVYDGERLVAELPVVIEVLP